MNSLLSASGTAVDKLMKHYEFAEESSNVQMFYRPEIDRAIQISEKEKFYVNPVNTVKGKCENQQRVDPRASRMLKIHLCRILKRKQLDRNTNPHTT